MKKPKLQISPSEEVILSFMLTKRELWKLKQNAYQSGNRRLDGISEHIHAPYDVLDDIAGWGNTTQGQEFWSQIHRQSARASFYGVFSNGA